MSMREAYVTKEAKLHYFTVEWNPDTLTWEDFRGKVLHPLAAYVAALTTASGSWRHRPSRSREGQRAPPCV